MTRASKKVSLYQEIIDHIMEQIRDGRLRPGARVPSQNQLAGMFGVSAITTRRALHELEEMGVINRIQGKGSFVCSRPKPVGEIGNIGFLVQHNRAGDNSNSKLFNPVIIGALRGAADAASTLGMRVSFHTLEHDAEFDDVGQKDAWLIFGTVSRSTVEAAVSRDIPVVTLISYFPDLNVPFVSFDNFAGGYLAASHLLELGHRKIALVGAPYKPYDQFSARMRGFQVAAEQHGLADHVTIVAESTSRESAACSAATSLFAKLRPTGIFAVTDVAALGVVMAARQAGIHVPNELSVVGYDDQPFAEYVSPALTTVRQNGFELGRRAFTVLESMLRGKPPSELRVEIPPVLVPRESSRPLVLANALAIGTRGGE